jgi:hypothetical protein
VDGPLRITPVHGVGLTPSDADGVRRLWSVHRVVADDRIDARLARVSVVGTDDGGEVVAVATAFAEAVPHLGSRRLHLHRRFLAPGNGWEAELQLLVAAFDALEPGDAPGPEREVGVFASVISDDLAQARPEARWDDAGFVHVGYGPNGHTQRVRYFEDARIA